LAFAFSPDFELQTNIPRVLYITGEDVKNLL